MSRASIKLESESRKQSGLFDGVEWGDRTFEIVFRNIEPDTPKSDAMVDAFIAELSRFGNGCRDGGDEDGEVILYIVEAHDVADFKAAYKAAKKVAMAAGRAA